MTEMPEQAMHDRLTCPKKRCMTDMPEQAMHDRRARVRKECHDIMESILWMHYNIFALLYPLHH